MSDPFFFGYGSLVNRDTHVYARAHRARVQGWRRAWRHVAPFERAFLTAVPARGAVIDGLIAAVPGADWAALDARETGYARHRVADGLAHEADHDVSAEIYAVPLDISRPASDAHPILLSYLDVVVQGYLREFGADGVAGFFQTTDGWDAPVLNDRAAPQYPRHKLLHDTERDLVDQYLRQIGARVVKG